MDKKNDIKRIIARLDIKGSNVVKTIQTEGLRIVGEPKALATKYYEEGADEIIYIDIVASLYQRDFNFSQLKSVMTEVFVPVTAGGGVRSLDDIHKMLNSGADKVAINTFAVSHPEFLKEASHVFGSQCIVLSVEAKKNTEGGWEAYTDGGRERTGRDIFEWIREATTLGVGELLLTSIDHDGTRKGYDIDLVNKALSVSSVPIIAHGGAGNSDHMIELIEKTNISAVSMSSVLHYDLDTIPKIKDKLDKAGITVRKI